MTPGIRWSWGWGWGWSHPRTASRCPLHRHRHRLGPFPPLPAAPLPAEALLRPVMPRRLPRRLRPGPRRRRGRRVLTGGREGCRRHRHRHRHRRGDAWPTSSCRYRSARQRRGRGRGPEGPPAAAEQLRPGGSPSWLGAEGGGIGRSQAMSDVQIMPEMAESRDGPREGAITSRHGDARWRGYESRVKEFTPPLSVFFLPSATVGCISYY